MIVLIIDIIKEKYEKYEKGNLFWDTRYLKHASSA
jgi:hypothetical protein